MKTTFILGTLTVIFGLISCENDNALKPEDIVVNDTNTVVYDTIKPLEYFPAYPGSYWVYNNGETLKVDGYEKYIYNTAGYTAVPDYDTIVIPKLILNGIFNNPDSYAYVKEYSISKSSNSNYRDPPFKGILSLNEGTEFTIGGAYLGHRITGKTIQADTSILIGNTTYNNVIVTIHFDYYCISSIGGSPEDCATLKEYYAKNIGLIKREKRNYPIDTLFFTEIEISEYGLNK